MSTYCAPCLADLALVRDAVTAVGGTASCTAHAVLLTHPGDTPQRRLTRLGDLRTLAEGKLATAGAEDAPALELLVQEYALAGAMDMTVPLKDLAGDRAPRPPKARRNRPGRGDRPEGERSERGPRPEGERSERGPRPARPDRSAGASTDSGTSAGTGAPGTGASASGAPETGASAPGADAMAPGAGSPAPSTSEAASMSSDSMPTASTPGAPLSGAPLPDGPVAGAPAPDVAHADPVPADS